MFKAIASFLDVFANAWTEYRGYNLSDYDLMIATSVGDNCERGKSTGRYLNYGTRKGGLEIRREVLEVVSEGSIGYGSYRQISRNIAEFHVPRHSKEARLVREYVRMWEKPYSHGKQEELDAMKREILEEISRIADEMTVELDAMNQAKVLKPSYL